jgi:ankyrin repeat protein
MDLLIYNNADVNKCDGRAPIHAAVSDHPHSPGRLELLVSHGVDLDVRTSEGNTALHLATMMELGSAVRTLLDSGADVNAVNRLGQSALHVARTSETAMALLDGNARTDLKDVKGRTALFYLVEFQAPEVIRNVLDRWENVNQSDNNSSTPLHLALWRGEYAVIIRTLLSKGANIHAKDKHGQTPLHLLCRAVCSWRSKNESVASFYPEVADLLLEKGAKVNETDNTGRTPMDYAIHVEKETRAADPEYSFSFEFVDYLKEKGGISEHDTAEEPAKFDYDPEYIRYRGIVEDMNWRLL